MGQKRWGRTRQESHCLAAPLRQGPGGWMEQMLLLLSRCISFPQ